MSANPFALDDDRAYQQWRSIKLSAYPYVLNELFCDIAAAHLSDAEKNCLQAVIGRYNFAVYRLKKSQVADKAFVQKLGSLVGLTHLDGNLCSDEDNITSLQVMDMGRANTYIPYTDKPLSWHTDGYYNPPEKQVKAISMHCVRPAQEGGVNLLMDHEMAYIQLRDENPGFIKALMHPQAMTIPPNVENGAEVRAAQTGPVFSVLNGSNALHMRYSARGRNIEWRDDAVTQEAVGFLKGLLNENNPYVIAYRLQAGEGIICNNILHNRSRFTDGDDQPGRLLYRARYYDRVENS